MLPRFSLALGAACVLVTGTLGWPQTDNPPPPKPTSPLKTLWLSVEKKAKELQDEELELGGTSESDPDYETQKLKVQRLRAEKAELEAKFETLSTGVDVARLDIDDPHAFDLQQELVVLLEPLVNKLKASTEEPRKIERLRNQVVLHRENIKIASRAIESLDANLLAADSDTKAELQILREKWVNKKQEYHNFEQIAAYELQTTQESRSSFFEATGEFLNDFFRSRGMNLLIAVGSFLVVFVALRFVREHTLKVIFRRRATFYSRLASVLLQVLSVLAAVGAMFLALFSVSDWVLLVVVLIFLAGICWAGARGLPQFFEQIRLLLNLGSVREKERVIVDGLPWRVDELKIYTVLRNPDLSGGEYRIPVRDLAGLHSRPIAPNEVWFPCREGDWVRLGDGTRARVVVQTPDLVQLMEPGGALKTYPTSDFLGQSPLNLSKDYRLQITFGIDYAHQAIATTEVPRIMQERVELGLAEFISDRELLSLVVEFKEAAASSLDYQVIADLAASTAGQYDFLKRAMSRILVETCNDQGWVIPFTQVTMHQA